GDSPPRNGGECPLIPIHSHLHRPRLQRRCDYSDRLFSPRSILRRLNFLTAGSLKPVGAEVAFAGIGKNGEQVLSAPEFLRDNAACMKNRAGGDPAKDAFLFG